MGISVELTGPWVGVYIQFHTQFRVYYCSLLLDNVYQFLKRHEFDSNLSFDLVGHVLKMITALDQVSYIFISLGETWRDSPFVYSNTSENLAPDPRPTSCPIEIRQEIRVQWKFSLHALQL